MDIFFIDTFRHGLNPLIFNDVIFVGNFGVCGWFGESDMQKLASFPKIQSLFYCVTYVTFFHETLT